MKRLLLILSIALIACSEEETVTPLETVNEVRVKDTQDKAPNNLVFEGSWFYINETGITPSVITLKPMANNRYKLILDNVKVVDTLYHTSANRLLGISLNYRTEINLFAMDLNLDINIPYNNATWFVNQNYSR